MAIEVKWCAYEKIGEMQAEDNKELFILTPASKNSDRSQGFLWFIKLIQI